MKLLAKAKNLLHKPSPTRVDSTLPSKAKQPASTGSPTPIRRLEINRGRADKELRGRRAPPPTLWIQAFGKRYEEVHKCLQDIKGLDFRDDGSIVAVSKLGEKALDSIVKAIKILLDPGHPEVDQLKSACTLICMVNPSVRVALLSELNPNHIRALALSADSEVRGAMNSALQAAGRDALRCADFSRFLKVLAFCSKETGVSLMELFPPLTTEIVQGLDKDSVIEAVRLTTERIMRLPDRHARLAELDSLLSIAGTLREVDLPRAVALKCIIWRALSSENWDPDPAVSSKLKELQYRALLPALTPQLLKSIPDGLDPREIANVAEEQKSIPQNFDAGLQHLFAAGSQRVEEEGAHALGSEIRVGEGIGFDPGQFLQVQLEGLGIPSNDDPRIQMIKALPALCDANHSPVLNSILMADQGKKLIAQALMDCLLKGHYSSAIVASLFTALADHVDLKSVLLKEIGQDTWASASRASVAMKMVIDFLKSGVPDGVKAAAKILPLTQESKVMDGSLRSQMRDLLPTLCEAGHSIDLHFMLSTKLGERLIAQAVEDYILQGSLSAAKVALLFKALAHRVDLRTTKLFSIDAQWLLTSLRPTPSVQTLIKQLASVQLEGDQLSECTRLLQQWRPGWRLLLVPCQDETAFSPHRFDLGIYSILSIKAIEDAGLDAERGGVRDRMALPSLRIPETLKTMLDISVAGQPLLSDEHLDNIMRAVVSSESLAKRTLDWLAKKDASSEVLEKVYKAMAYALIRIQHDLSQCRFDEQSRANHAVGAVASHMEKTMPLELKAKFQDNKKEWWIRLAECGLISPPRVPRKRIH